MKKVLLIMLLAVGCWGQMYCRDNNHYHFDEPIIINKGDILVISKRSIASGGAMLMSDPAQFPAEWLYEIAKVTSTECIEFNDNIVAVIKVGKSYNVKKQMRIEKKEIEIEESILEKWVLEERK